MKLILVAGLPRSGSTWMFNAIRIILKQAGIKFNHCNLYYPKLSSIVEGAEYEIIKIHDWKEQLASSAHFIFTSFRDPYEVLNSYNKFKPDAKVGEKWIEKAVHNYYKWQNISSFDMDYNAFIKDKKSQISAICSSLNINCNSDKIIEELSSLKPPMDRIYDPETCYFRNHIDERYL